MEPEFELSEVEPETGRAALGNLLLVLAIRVAVPLALAGAGVLAWNLYVFPGSERGTCLSFDSSLCQSLTEQTIEDIGMIELPDGAEILDSGSRTGLQSGRAWAVVLIPEGAEATLSGDYHEAEVSSEVPTFGAGSSFLENKGFASLESVSVMDVGSKAYRKVFFGTDANKERLLYVLKWQEYPGGLFTPGQAATP